MSKLTLIATKRTDVGTLYVATTWRGSIVGQVDAPTYADAKRTIDTIALRERFPCGVTFLAEPKYAMDYERSEV